MGRVKLQLKKIENKTYRHITFAKRKSGLIKKAYELSTLCDVELALMIFSPAGKLILFDGKKRVEKILMHYINLPEHQRGRLNDEEVVRQIITQMCLEAELRHQIISSGDREGRMSIDSRLEELKTEISFRHAELEEVERQLQFFVRSPSSIKTISEAESHEQILEETLKLVSIHKESLEAKLAIQLSYNLEKPLHLPNASLMFGNYFLNWPQQHETQFLASNFADSTPFQPLRNQSQLFGETLQSPSPCLHSNQYPGGSAERGAPELVDYISLSEYGKFYNADFSLGMSNFNQMQHGRASKVVDGDVGNNLPLPY
ncbi:agamous-like MADS-box protein MADS2 [Mangifera indica]|uniref:agamous-like MADS-box protein MADS2 n=1 Tax=Mangifera indica TaxID=29780 RepID=UPI001CF97450|nr:agamous-like MADS-box protein MADS2 [Mangifera indica]